MQNITLVYNVNPFEHLFIDKALELLFKNSIDSYRLRLHNPKTLIEELVSVCQSSLSGFLTNNDYASSTAKELSNSLSEDTDGLRFVKISKNHYQNILGQANPKNYSLLIQSSKLVLKDNPDYLTNIFEDLETLTASFGGIVNDGSPRYHNEIAASEKRIIVLLNHFFVGLIGKGFNKQYLHSFFQITFVRNTDAMLDFTGRLTILKTLINRASENFTVMFNLLGSSFQFAEFKKIDPSYELMTKARRQQLRPILSAQVYDFLVANKQSFVLCIKVQALDYYKAIEKSMEKISRDMDIYHLGFTKHSFKVDNKCVVIGDNDPSKSATFPINFQIDGYVSSNASLFRILLDKLQKVQQNQVDKESYDKLLSAIRYYRTGSESPELETKLLNYWIGLEYIFTSFAPEQKTIERIRTSYPKCHSLVYVKRNLWDFHVTLKRLGVSHLITGYNDDLEYLTLYATYQEIIDNSPNELLKFRAKYFRKWVETPSNIEEALRRHTTNLNWNLTRLYRIRNEIVHNAAIKQGIYTHISHLKYYLTFVLNAILDFMAEVNVDLNNDGKVSIDDYFIAQDIILGSMKGGKVGDYIKIENPAQIFH